MATRQEILRTSIEALQASSHQLALEQERRAGRSKGKLKATPQDEEAEAETEKRLAQLSTAASELSKELAQDDVVTVPDAVVYSKADGENRVFPHGSPQAETATWDLQDEGPIYNPFTGHYVYRETGFEPGPSVQYEGLEKQEKASSLSIYAEDDICQSSEHGSLAPHGSTAEESLDEPAEDDSQVKWQPQNNIGHDTKPINGDVDRRVRYRLGFMVSILESWIPFRIRGLVSQGSSFSRCKQPTESNTQHEAQTISDDANPITTSISSSTITAVASRSSESPQCLSTAPSSISSVRSIDDAESLRYKLHSEQRQAKQEEPGKERLVLSEQDRMEVIQLEEQLGQDVDRELQVGKADADRQKALAFEQDCMEAIRLQEELDREDAREWQATQEYVKGLEEAIQLQEQFNLEEERERQATLEYVRGLEKAIQLQEEEEQIQAQQQAALIFAHDLEQANLEHDMQLGHERAVQQDRKLAQELQSQLDSENIVEKPVLVDRVKPQRPIAENVPQTSRASMYQRAPSHHESNTAQDAWTQASKDRALALELYRADQAKAVEEKARSKELHTWQRMFEASDTEVDHKEKAAIKSAIGGSVGHNQHVGGTKTPMQQARGPWAKQPSTQTCATQAAQVATANDVADCGICGDSIPKTQLIKPCEHYYCRKCMTGSFPVKSSVFHLR